MRRNRGITLMEVLIVAVCMAIILGATVSAVSTAITHTTAVKASRVAGDRAAAFEDRLRNALGNAYLSSSATDTKSYFRGGPDVAESQPGKTNDPTSLVFTALSPRVPSELIGSQDDFETLNQSYGPKGGLTEYALGMNPIGDAPVDTGLFLRYQTPADGDPTQGGMQTLIDPDVDSISYEFYNGTSWETTWDTQQSSTPRLPASVRITYHRKDEANDRVFVVRLIHSDVTPENPVTDGVQQ